MNAVFKKGFETLQKFSAFLLLGTVVALVWANIDAHTYEHFVESRLISPDVLQAWMQAGGFQGMMATLYSKVAYLLAHDPATIEGLRLYHETHQIESPHTFNFHFIVNDLFMVLFFGIASKEVSESFLPGGALSSLSKASMPAIATLGGVLGPVAVFFALNFVLAPTPRHHPHVGRAHRDRHRLLLVVRSDRLRALAPRRHLLARARRAR